MKLLPIKIKIHIHVHSDSKSEEEEKPHITSAEMKISFEKYELFYKKMQQIKK